MRGSEGGTEVEQEETRKLENEGKGKGSSRNERQERGEEKRSVVEGGRKGKADIARQKESREGRARSVLKCEPAFFVPCASVTSTLTFRHSLILPGTFSHAWTAHARSSLCSPKS